ncbi:DoxX family membrane protein [Aureimonas psammosilenae]|uniref:DoxX family membrane protein n=1 Tax=Aureimonas psammosilenae TaxID=2495496 RepID=UPI001260C141|nr:DoxX family membrane protein [Aureimonas psammosilenae]
MEIVIAFLIRLILVLLFLPFSAADKIVNFSGAVSQASELAPSRGLAKLLIFTGLTVEIVMSLGVLTGFFDKAAALILALYCMATAVLWKRFWATGDFAFTGPSRGRELMWDFWKNFALAGGFLLITFGTTARTVDAFFADPLGSTHPYSITETAP